MPTHNDETLLDRYQREALVDERIANRDCWCRACRPITLDDMRMVLCPECGNKRCPKANDHRNACTGSNDPANLQLTTQSEHIREHLADMHAARYRR